jgi:hypothetical protein
MNGRNYIGLDIHKKSISCCVRQADSTIIQEGTITATRSALGEWVRRLPQPWTVGIEATPFTGWIYDKLISCGAVVKVAHPQCCRLSLPEKRKTIGWMRERSPTYCAATTSRNVTGHRAKFGTAGVLRYNVLVREAGQMKNQ